MARYLKSVCKMSRRVGYDLQLKGARDISTKCKLKVFPGQHGAKKKKIRGDYYSQLLSKQMIKFTYGVLEKQFRCFYKKMSKKKGSCGELLLKYLECRLDNVVFRMGFSLTRAEARQLISHKSIEVTRNACKRVVSIPSYIVRENDTISIRGNCKKQIRIRYSLKCATKIGFFKWVSVNVNDMSGIFLRKPERNELSKDFKEQMVVEFYSR